MPSDAAIADAILAVTADRAGTACPSEAARALAADWRPLMPQVRRVAQALADDGRLVITQGGRPADASTRGPIRIAQPGGGSKRPANR